MDSPALVLKRSLTLSINHSTSNTSNELNKWYYENQYWSQPIFSNLSNKNSVKNYIPSVDTTLSRNAARKKILMSNDVGIAVADMINK
jgi:hypothetical protein